MGVYPLTLMHEEPRFRTRFELSARLYTPSPDVDGEIRASLDKLKALMPSEIDPAEHPTILYVVGNLFVPGTLNKNGDGVSIEDGFRIYKGFEGQQIDIEHNRSHIAGYIVKAGLSEFGTDRLITEEEARTANKPYNVAIVVAVWKHVNRKLAQYIIESAAPGSPTKNDINLSFEVGFNDYFLVTLPKGTINLALASRTIMPDNQEFAIWDKFLPANKGKGVYGKGKDQEIVGRVLLGTIIPMGGGFVGVPAGAVSGIVPILPEETVESVENTDAGIYEYSSTQVTLGSEAAEPFKSYAQSIKEEDLYYSDKPEEDGKYGREDEPHITALYGIKGLDAEPIQKACQGCGPIKATLGKVTSFENDDKPYDVLKVDVISEDLERLHALIKASCDCEVKWPEFHPHLTIAYVRKGLAVNYIGDARFEGKELVFSSLTFSPYEGDRTEIPLSNAIATVQTLEDLVYTTIADLEDILMASPFSKPPYITLSAGWKNLVAANLKAYGSDVLLDVALSDNTWIKAKIFNESTLIVDPSEFPSQEALAGVIITSINAIKEEKPVEVAASAIIPLKRSKHVDAALETINQIEASISSITRINQEVSSVSTSSTQTQPISQPMNLDTLKQAVAAVKSVEDLPTVMANVNTFVEAITKASEEAVAKRAAAEQAAQQAQATLQEVQAQLATLTKSHNDMIAAQQIAAAEQAFQTRMASVDEVFTFDKESSPMVAAEIKACTDDASFSAWLTRAKVMYKGYLKDAVSTTTAGENPFAKKGEEEDKKKKEEECEASKVAATEAAAKVALASVTVTDSAITNTVETSNTESLKDRLIKIASRNTRIGGETLETINARSTAPKQTR